MPGLNHQYLKEMGIDVWVLRQAPIPKAAPETLTPTARAPVTADPPRTSAPARSDPGSAAGPAPQFHLYFVSQGAFSAVFSLGPDAKVAPEALNRFGRDLLFALAGAFEPAMASFRWPMIKSANLDQSEQAARQALAQRINACGPNLIVFGETAQQWVGNDSGKRCLNLPEFETYFRDPPAKRDLWQQLQQFIPVAPA